MRKRIFRELFLLGILFVLVCTSTHHSWAAEKKYPSGSIDVICGLTPGGPGDVATRLLAKRLEKYFGVTVVPQNKPGGGGIIANSALANSRPDGYTIALSGAEAMILPTLLGLATFSIEDFRVVGQVCIIPDAIAVSPDSPWGTFQELIDYARKNPGVKYGHPGVGSTVHLRMENLNKSANLGMVGIPFRGDQEVIAAVLGGHVPIAVGGLGSFKIQSDAGKMKLIFSFEPSTEVWLDPNLPDLPTVFGKSVSDFDVPFYLVVPRKTPDEIVQVLERALGEITKNPEFINDLKKLYLKAHFVDGNTIMQKLLPKRISQIKATLQHLGMLK